MAAAAMGATAFQKGLGAMHSLSHPIGAIYGAHHGMTNAVFMPYVLEYQPSVDRAERSRGLAAYLGLAADFDAFLELGARACAGNRRAPYAGRARRAARARRRDRRDGDRRPDGGQQPRRTDQSGGARFVRRGGERRPA